MDHDQDVGSPFTIDTILRRCEVPQRAGSKPK